MPGAGAASSALVDAGNQQDAPVARPPRQPHRLGRRDPRRSRCRAGCAAAPSDGEDHPLVGHEVDVVGEPVVGRAVADAAAPRARGSAARLAGTAADASRTRAISRTCGTASDRQPRGERQRPRGEQRARRTRTLRNQPTRPTIAEDREQLVAHRVEAHLAAAADEVAGDREEPDEHQVLREARRPDAALASTRRGRTMPAIDSRTSSGRQPRRPRQPLRHAAFDRERASADTAPSRGSPASGSRTAARRRRSPSRARCRCAPRAPRRLFERREGVGRPTCPVRSPTSTCFSPWTASQTTAATPSMRASAARARRA